MIKLDAGNVLLKPSHRKQLMSSLKRSMVFGSRLGDFNMTISMQRIGRAYEVRASVHDAAGDFGLRTRQSDWRSALRELVNNLCARLHDQYISRIQAL